jgi:hypothetical protein
LTNKKKYRTENIGDENLKKVNVDVWQSMLRYVQECGGMAKY